MEEEINILSKEERYEIFRLVNFERARAFDKLVRETAISRNKAVRKITGSSDYEKRVRKIKQDYYNIKVLGFKNINKRFLPAIIYKF